MIPSGATLLSAEAVREVRKILKKVSKILSEQVKDKQFDVFRKKRNILELFV